MSEKRFIRKGTIISDIQNGTAYLLESASDCNRLLDLLNEQQTTISKQLDQIIELQDKYRILEFNHSRLENRNKAQYEKIGEQQATITKLKELNDDKGKKIISLIRTNKTLKEENEQLKQYKLYEDNKRLQTIIADLKEENEQLRKELGDCEKFRYTVFQRMRDVLDE